MSPIRQLLVSTLIPAALACGACTPDQEEVATDATGGSSGASSIGTSTATSGGGATEDPSGSGSAGSTSGSATTTASTSGSGTTGSGTTGGGTEPPALDCGTPEFPEGSSLRRYPYLQSAFETSMRIAWTTTSGGEGKVRFAPGPDGPWTEVVANTRLFEVSYTGDTDDYTAYDAQLTGLTPNSAYCYEVVEGDQVLARGLRFDTAWGNNGRPVRIIAHGDSGDGGAAQRRVAEQMLASTYDIFLDLGDMAYGDGQFDEFEDNKFFPYRTMAHRVVDWPAPGNHEYNTDNAQPYLDVYYLPEVAPQEEDKERFYSFDYGNVHFVSLDSNGEQLTPNIDDEENGDQNPNDMYSWFRRDMAGSQQEWKVVFMHHPPYSTSSRGVNFALRNTLAPIMEETGADIVLAGHDHHYERTVPIRNQMMVDPSTGGTYYFVVGTGGSGLRAANGDWFTEYVQSERHGALELIIDGCTASGRFINLDGEVMDSFELPGCAN
jgi:hypothetical protein